MRRFFLVSADVLLPRARRRKKMSSARPILAVNQKATHGLRTRALFPRFLIYEICVFFCEGLRLSALAEEKAVQPWMAEGSAEQLVGSQG